MEENNFETGASDIYVTKDSANLLLSISKWSKFLSIVGFVILGLMVIMLLFTGILISSMNYYADVTAMYPYVPGTFSWGFGIIYLIIMLVYFIPIFMLYKFSVNAKKAVEANNTRFFTQALRFLDSHYKVIGIMTIVTIVFFIFALIRMFLMMRGMMM